jgi:hypothetical protein
MGKQERNNNDRVFAPLAFVNTERIRKGKVIKIETTVAYRAAILEAHDNGLFFCLNRNNFTNIAVVHITVIIVTLLDHSITYSKSSPAAVVFGNPRTRRIEGCLQGCIERSNPGHSFVRGTENLNITARIDSEPARNALDNQLYG